MTGSYHESLDPSDIVVTAQKRSESINSVGLSITAFAEGEVKLRHIQTALDLANHVPGLVINNSGAQGSPNYTIRGVGFANPYANGSSTVGLYADEVAIPYPAMSRGAIFDLERIEVLKGPQGDLYGRNTTGGQINLISAKPTRTFRAGFDLSYGRFSEVKAEAFVSGPIASDVQARIALTRTRSDGWQRSLTRPGDTLGKRRKTGMRGLVNFDLGQGSLLLRGYYSRDTSDNVAMTAYDGRIIGLPTAQPLPTIGSPVFSIGDNRAADWTPGFRPARNDRFWGASVKLQYPLGPAELTSITAFDRFERDEVNDWDGAAINDTATRDRNDVKSFSQEVRMSSADKQPLSWIVGGYFSRDRFNDTYLLAFPQSFFKLALGINQIETRYVQRTRSIAGFGHAEYDINPTLRVIAGLRYTDEMRSFRGCGYDVDGTVANATNAVITPIFVLPAGLPNPGPMQAGGCSTYDDRPSSPTFGTFSLFDGRIDTREWMWKAGLNHTFGRDMLAYATLSSGFKSGGFNGSAPNTASQIGPYKPERLTSYEAGIKLSLPGRRAHFNGSIFYYDYRDKQEQDFAVTFVGAIPGLTNIPRSRIYGAELSADLYLGAAFSVNMGASYLNSRVLEWHATSLASAFPNVVRTDASGGRLPNAPKWSANVAPRYQVAVSDRLMLGGSGELIYRSSTTGGARPTDATDAYLLINAELNLAATKQAWRFAAFGKNIFNRYYFPSAFRGGNGSYVRENGLPATYGVRFSYRY